jgi:hypothetical protein
LRSRSLSLGPRALYSPRPPRAARSVSSASFDQRSFTALGALRSTIKLRRAMNKKLDENVRLTAGAPDRPTAVMRTALAAATPPVPRAAAVRTRRARALAPAAPAVPAPAAPAAPAPAAPAPAPPVPAALPAPLQTAPVVVLPAARVAPAPPAHGQPLALALPRARAAPQPLLTSMTPAPCRTSRRLSSPTTGRRLHLRLLCLGLHRRGPLLRHLPGRHLRSTRASCPCRATTARRSWTPSTAPYLAASYCSTALGLGAGRVTRSLCSLRPSAA